MEIHAKPEPRPNACPACGAFAKIGDEYLPPTTHYGGCRNYIDHGVLRLAGRQQAPNGFRRVR